MDSQTEDKEVAESISLRKLQTETAAAEFHYLH